MILPTTRKTAPAEVADLLYEYWSRRQTSTFMARTKQNPKSPLDRLCDELFAIQEIVENYRDALIRENGTYVPPKKALVDDVKRRLEELLAPRTVSSQADDAGQRFIDDWKQTFARFRCTTYAGLVVDPKDESIEIPMRDIAKLSAIALALKDESERAKQSVQAMAQQHFGADKDDITKDRATAWLLREWPKRCPALSRRGLARWISQFRIEDATPEKIEDRLRKAEKRRKQGGTPPREAISTSPGRSKRRVVQRPGDATAAKSSGVPRTR